MSGKDGNREPAITGTSAEEFHTHSGREKQVLNQLIQ